MKSTDFVSSSELQRLIVNRKKDVDGNKINWLSFRSIKYSKREIFLILVNNNIHIDLRKRSIEETHFKDCELEYLFPFGRSIDKKKYDDLKTLLKFVPSEHHDFYKALKCDENQLDYGLASDAEDSEDVDISN